MRQAYTIGRLAAAAGVNVETVRYYQRRGLMPVPDRPYASVRRYADAELQRLRFIKRAQSVGFTLVEVQSLLELRGRDSCRATRDLIAEKLDLVKARHDELGRLKKELAHWIAECDANAKKTSCPAIDHLSPKS